MASWSLSPSLSIIALIEIVLEILLNGGPSKLAQRRVLVWRTSFLEIFEILWEHLLLLLYRRISGHCFIRLIRGVSLVTILLFCLIELNILSIGLGGCLIRSLNVRLIIDRLIRVTIIREKVWVQVLLVLILGIIVCRNYRAWFNLIVVVKNKF